MIAAILARKSNEQEQKGASGASESIERQVEHAKEYIARKDWQRVVGADVRLGPDLIWQDDGVSGATYAKLEGRKQMIAAAEAGLFQILVVSEQGRLGRDMIESAYTIKTIAESGVRIFSYMDDQEISVEDEVAQAMTMLRGFAAASERRQTSKRVYDAAFRRVKARQVAGAKCFGYDNVAMLGPTGKKDHVERRVNEVQAAIVLRIFVMYADGLGSVNIARMLNAEGVPSPRPRGWSQTTVRGVLRNPLYRGEIIWGRIKTVVRKGKDYNARRPETEWYRDHDENLRIVPEDLWLKVQARRESNRRAIPRSPKTGQLLGRPTWHDGHSEYLVTGFGRCVSCGGSIRITHRVHGPKHNRVSVRSYTCAINDNLGTGKCTNNVIVRHDILDGAILSAIAGVLDARLLEDAVDHALARLREGQAVYLDRRTQVALELQGVQQRIDRLVEALADGTLPGDEIRSRLKVETTRKAALTEELDALGEAGKAASLDAERIKADLRERVADVRALLTENTQQGRAMLRKLLEGPIECEAFREEGRKGYRFRGTLTIKRLISGEAASVMGATATGSARQARHARHDHHRSPTGTTRAGRSAAVRGRGRRACGCRAPGRAWPR